MCVQYMYVSSSQTALAEFILLWTVNLFCTKQKDTALVEKTTTIEVRDS